MIPRRAAAALRRLARGFPIVALTGPRQSGKTTLARATFPRKPYVSLEDPDERRFALEDPRGFLDRFRRGAVLDEAQRTPELFSYLQTEVDRDRRPGRFVLTGSQNLGLMATLSQSLAGRSAMVQLLPLALSEVRGEARASDINELLVRGLYPALYDRKLRPADWHAGYFATYIERDVRQLANVQDLRLFERFVRLCAARSGQLLNLSALASDCGISDVSARRWLSVLEASYIVHLLPPHHRNFGKRLVKSPKLCFVDAGLAAFLLGIHTPSQMSVHASRPALFETLVAAELLKARFNDGLPSNLYFWRNNIGIEIDLVLEQASGLVPIEIKSGRTPSADWLRNLRLWMGYAGKAASAPQIVYGGEEDYRRSGVRIRSWRGI